jgi:hypothetical protein
MTRANKELGDRGEAFAAELLAARGYTVTMLPTNFPTYDLEVSRGATTFLVSVKASRDREHVRLGTRASVERLEEGNFVMALLPKTKAKIFLADDGYRLLVIPAKVAREDALHVHDTYCAMKGHDKGYSIMVKGYSRRQQQREVWARWKQYEDGWDFLPS